MMRSSLIICSIHISENKNTKREQPKRNNAIIIDLDKWKQVLSANMSSSGACDPCIFYLIRPFVGTTYLIPFFSRKVKKMSSATNHYQQFIKETNHYQGKLRNMVQSKKKGHNINKCFYYVKVPSNKRENNRREKQ